MKIAFSLLFIILSLLTFKNVAFARSAVEECFMYYNFEYYNIAIGYGKIAVKYYPNNPAAHYCLGLSYYAVREFKLALKHVKRAESLTSNKYDGIGYYHLSYVNYKGKLNLGDTYRRMKDYEKAEKYLLEGLEDVKKVRDKYWEATGYKYLGWLYRDKMDKKTAQNYLTRYRDLDWLYKNKRGKNTAEDYLIRAYILYKSIGKEKEAKEVLSDIRELKKER